MEQKGEVAEVTSTTADVGYARDVTTVDELTVDPGQVSCSEKIKK